MTTNIEICKCCDRNATWRAVFSTGETLVAACELHKAAVRAELILKMRTAQKLKKAA